MKFIPLLLASVQVFQSVSGNTPAANEVYYVDVDQDCPTGYSSAGEQTFSDGKTPAGYLKPDQIAAAGVAAGTGVNPTQNGGGNQTPNNSGNQTPNDSGNQTPNNRGNQTPNSSGNQTPNNSGNQTPNNGGGNPPPNNGDNSPPNNGGGNTGPASGNGLFSSTLSFGAVAMAGLSSLYLS